MQYYRLDLRKGGSELSDADAAVLCAQLPRDGRVFCVIDPDNAASRYDVMLLRNVEYWAHVLTWQQTEDGVKGRREPEYYPLPSELESRSMAEDADARAYVDKVLGIKPQGGES